MGLRVSDVVVIGVLGGIAYWLYKNVATPLTPALNAAGDTIASLFPGTSPQVEFNESLMIQFPDGSQIPVSQMTGQAWQGNTLTFPFNGSTWALSPQVNNVYMATQLSGLGSYDEWNDDPLLVALMGSKARR